MLMLDAYFDQTGHTIEGNTKILEISEWIRKVLLFAKESQGLKK